MRKYSFDDFLINFFQNLAWVTLPLLVALMFALIYSISSKLFYIVIVACLVAFVVTVTELLLHEF